MQIMEPDPLKKPEKLRAVIVASRFNEMITKRLVEGANAALMEAGLSPDRIYLYWVPGAFEIPAMMHEILSPVGEFEVDILVALGAVVRGETAHFDYVAGEASRGIMQCSLKAAEQLVAVGFGLLTTESIEQAVERAGGSCGNKGADAAKAALDMLRNFRSRV